MDSGERVKIYIDRIHPQSSIEIASLVKFCNHGITVDKPTRALRSFFILIDKLGKRNKNRKQWILRRFKIYSEEVENLGPSFSKPFKIYRGFFQNWEIHRKYVDTSLDEIESYFSEGNLLNNSLKVSEVNKEEFSRITSIHVRRGDFIENKDSTGVLANQYFINQIEPDTNAIFLSDDQSFIDSILKESRTYKGFGPAETNAWQTLFILSRARILLMSNSTLSWWASQLVLRRNGKAFCPTPWTKSAENSVIRLEDVRLDLVPAIFE